MSRRVVGQLMLVTALVVGLSAYVFVQYGGDRGEAVASGQNGVSHVYLESTGAKPDLITIDIGQTVQFNARDGRNHQIVQEANAEHKTSVLPGWLVKTAQAHGQQQHQAGGIQSGTFGPDEAFQAKFDKRGIYKFADHLNPNISVVVVVSAGGI